MTTPEKIRRRQRLMILLQGVTAVVAVVALVIAVAVNAANIHLANQERIQARYANCLLLRRIVLIATPRARLSRARVFLSAPHNPLANCERYAHLK